MRWSRARCCTVARPVPLHREKHPNLDVEGCFGCKATGIRFGTVPGGARDAKTNISLGKRREKDLHRYREKKRAGERPSGTTAEAMDRDSYKQTLWEKHEKNIADHNSPEQVKAVRKSLLNQ